jgi:transposase
MPRAQHRVLLSPKDRDALQHLITTGTHPAPLIRNARIILACDRADPHRPVRTDAEVAAMLETSIRTVSRARAAWCRSGMDGLPRKVRQTPPTPRKIDDAATLRLAELRLEDPPEGHATWSLRLLRDRAVELAIIDPVVVETVRQALQQGGSSTSRPPAAS